LIDNGVVIVAGDIPFIVTPESDRRLDGRVDGKGPFF
jgi:hypothetical protein